MEMEIKKSFNWSMGHRLMKHKGLCYNPHGHNYKIDLCIYGELNEDGMVMDFSEVKKQMKPIIDELDHCFIISTSDGTLVDMFEGSDFKIVAVPFETTAENLVIWLYDRIKKETDIPIRKLELFETDGNSARHTGFLTVKK